jgi:hypothetical protein
LVEPAEGAVARAARHVTGLPSSGHTTGGFRSLGTSMPGRRVQGKFSDHEAWS